MQISPEWVKVQEAVAEALRSTGNAWGPRLCEHGSYSECEAGCEPTETRPDPDAILTEFIVVGNWVRMADGESDITMVSAPQQLHTHTIGLLHTALFEA